MISKAKPAAICNIAAGGIRNGSFEHSEPTISAQHIATENPICNHLRKTVRHVVKPYGPAFMICPACFRQVRRREPHEAALRRWNILFRARPWIFGFRGALFAPQFRVGIQLFAHDQGELAHSSAIAPAPERREV